jgi:hypothetical protein
MAAEQFANNAVTSLSGAITAAATSLSVQPASGFPTQAPFRIVIDGELMMVTAVSGTNWTVNRGIENTTAAAHADGAAVVQVLTAGAVSNLSSSQNPALCEGRLTLASGNPVTTSDVSGGTLYLTPYLGNRVALFDGTQWKLYVLPYSPGDVSLALSVTSGTNYDVFLYDNAGTLTLELSAWLSGTGRDLPDKGLVLQDGVYVRSDDHTRRYLGTIRASGPNTASDTMQQRFVWNYYNRLRRVLRRLETSSLWTYASTTWRQANGSSLNKVEYVVGQPEIAAHVETHQQANGNAVIGYNSQAEDSTAAPSTDVLGTFAGLLSTIWGELTTVRDWFPAAGYHYTAWLERTDGNSVTFNTANVAGLSGWLEG